MKLDSLAGSTKAPSADELLLMRFSRLLGSAGGMVTRLCEGQFGITRREWRVMTVLQKSQGILPSQLAELALLDRARTSRAITSLVGKGLVARAPRPGNRREAVLTLTAKGQQVHDELIPLAVDINRQLTAVLTTQQAQQLDAMLQQLQVRADAMVAQADLPKADRRRGSAREIVGPDSG